MKYHATRASRTRRSSTHSRLVRLVEVVRLNFAFALLGISLVGVICAIGIASTTAQSALASGGPSGAVANPGVKTGNGSSTATCGLTGQPHCATGIHWITLHSQAPGDVIAAVRQSQLFKVDRSGNGDYIKDLSHLGVPQFVQAMRTTGWTSATMPDFYVIPVYGRANETIGAVQVALSPDHSQIRVISIDTYSQPRPAETIARGKSADALAAVAAQHHAHLRVGARAQLVYFPFDFNSLYTGQTTWTGGGMYPSDPMWLVPGDDGKDHFVDVHNQAYYVQQLPIHNPAN